MDESVRSGGVLKKKTSSGCLIIKKKDDRALGVGMGMGGVARSGSYPKKRARMAKNDSELSDELPEPSRFRGGENSHNVSAMYRSEAVENGVSYPLGSFHNEKNKPGMTTDDSESSDELLETFRHGVGKNSVNSHRGTVMYGGGVVGKEFFHTDGVIENERKRTKFALSEVNEYNEFEAKNVRNAVIEKRKNLYLDGSGSGNIMSARTKSFYYGAKNRFVRGDDEVHFPASSTRLKYQEATVEPIRLQGKNGVLKVMVNKKTNMDLLQSKLQNVEDRKASMSEHVKKEPRVQPMLYADSKRAEFQPSSIGREKSELKSQKPLREGTTSTADSETGSSVKRVKEEEIRPSSAAETNSEVNKEGKVKRGGSTEKQQLRERIRGMLIEAGWTIDYRPRRNRDYLDAVYISPFGSAYWSIIKAYEAFEKYGDKNNSGGVSTPAAPLSADLINKLTRQTKKKMEKEMKKKKKDESASRDDKKTMGKESVEGTGSDQHNERFDSHVKKKVKPVKGKSHVTGNEDRKFCSTSESSRLKQDTVVGTNIAPSRNIILGKKSQVIGRCTLLVRNFERGQQAESDGFIPYCGKRTLLAWMIDSGTVKLSEKVQYMNRRKTRVKLEGWVTRDGIHCGCCSKILTVSKFELHAGSKVRQPFVNIVLDSGVSLLQCLIDSWNRQKESERLDFCAIGINGDDPDDDTCGICGDGGDLICCDGCPSTFHQSCLGIEVLPPGDWHCPTCTCKFCGVADENLSGDNKDANELLFCNLCEKKYHKSCRREESSLPMNTNGSSTFCGHTCQELYDHLQKILGVKHELESGLSWSLIQRSELDSDTSHRAFPQRVECNSKLSLALSIMNECFLPIVDRRSEINIIHNVMYNCGSNLNRINYRGFYTAILERGDEIISAASFRIHGRQLAEMPFIGTRHINRRQGMCRRLLSSIEMVLSSLGVEKLFIPAVPDQMHIWTSVFGFKNLEESQRHEIKSLNMLVFPGTDMLQKQLVKQEASNGLKCVGLRNPHKSEASSDANIAQSSMDPNIGNDTEYAIRAQISPTTSAPSDTEKPNLNQCNALNLNSSSDLKGSEETVS